MSLAIIEGGLSDTIQDLGRPGYAHAGINPGGTMDHIAASVANFLVGNDEREAVIEMHYPAPCIRFNKPAIIAICGADFSPELDEYAVPCNTPLRVRVGSTLRFKKPAWGVSAYLAVSGGLDIPAWLGSYSTNAKAKMGGHQGRQLVKKDEIGFKTTLNALDALPENILHWHADVQQLYTGEAIRIMKGKEYDRLTDCSVTILEGNTFPVSSRSDRMGYRLSGSPLQLTHATGMISSAVTKGTIQLLPDGQAIILMSDHQTTGGYPRIAHVIGADQPRLAQMRPHTAIRFQLVSPEEAERLLLAQFHHLQQLKNACTFRLEQFFRQHAIG
ncbi:MAG: biotin-dependent carboxyltransferase family protein [Chitinophagaceae bacterium]|nr:biotin-dependent carboxyltransferase family protein [Chitinophagaceae bacterium]